MTPDRGNNRTPAQRLIDELLDGGHSSDRSHELLEAIRRDAGACEELALTRIGIARLAEPIETPDLSGAILSRVHSRRRFLPREARRLVTAGRFGVAAGVVGAVALASFVQRHAPPVRLGEGPAPVSRVVEATEQTSASRPMLATQTVETIQASLASPVSGLSLSPRFRPEEGLRFDLALQRTPGQVSARYTAQGAPIVLGAPVQFDPLLAPSATQAESPFIGRFGSLLVVLREPQPDVIPQPRVGD